MAYKKNISEGIFIAAAAFFTITLYTILTQASPMPLDPAATYSSQIYICENETITIPLPKPAGADILKCEGTLTISPTYTAKGGTVPRVGIGVDSSSGQTIQANITIGFGTPDYLCSLNPQNTSCRLDTNIPQQLYGSTLVDFMTLESSEACHELAILALNISGKTLLEENKKCILANVGVTTYYQGIYQFLSPSYLMETSAITTLLFPPKR